MAGYRANCWELAIAVRVANASATRRASSGRGAKWRYLRVVSMSA
jgi:hypothetical protein